MKKLLLTYLLTLAAVIGVQAQSTITDELTLSNFGVSGTSYKTVEDVTATSNAKYAGQLAGGNNSIQLRSNNSNSGIITTQSGGVAKTITLEWNTNTASGRTVEVYGSNEAYSEASELYNVATQGTRIGTIVYGTSTELEVAGSYTYIGLRSNSGALYLNKITITWDNSVPVVETVSTPKITPSCTFEGSQEVTITCETEGADIYYTTDGTEPSESNGELYEAPFTITETTTVKAVAVAEEMNNSSTVEATYEKIVPSKGCYVKVTEEPEDWSGKYLIVYESGSDAYVFSATDAAYAYISATTEGGIIGANSNLDNEIVTIETMDGGYSILTRNGYIYGISSDNALNFNKTTPKLNTIELADNGSVTITSGRVLRFNSNVDQLRFRYYSATGTQKFIHLYKYCDNYELEVTSAGWASLCLGFNAEIPEGVTAYTVSDVDGEEVTLSEVISEILPANTAVLIKAESGKYIFNATTEPASNAYNMLEGTLTETTITPAGDSYYVLANGDNGIGLYIVDEDPATDGYEAFTLAANKAYLRIEGPAESNGFSFRIEGTTGIDEVKGENGNVKAIYDLTGRRVERINAPGIYIINGKKVVVK